MHALQHGGQNKSYYFVEKSKCHKLLTTFINGGVFSYSFVFMLIGPTGLILVEIFF